MATYLKYSDIPVYANFASENTPPTIDTATYMFAVTEASLSIEPILTPNRFLGGNKTRTNFSTTGPAEGKFSMTFFPLIEKTQQTKLAINKSNQIKFFETTGDFRNGHQIKISNFLLKQCYLQNYSVKINAYQPISVTANFIVFDITSITGTSILATSNIPSVPKDSTQPYYESLHALTTTIDGSSTNIPSTKINIDINVDCARMPIYQLGSKIPDDVVLNTVDRTTNIQGENVGKIIGVTGAGAGATTIYFLPLSEHGKNTPSLGNNVLSFDINGIVTSQQLSTSQGSILNGRVVIKEIIL